MNCRRSMKRRRRAAAAVEMAVLAPLLITVLLGIWEVGRMIEVQQLVNNAAREGARKAAVGSMIDPTTGSSKNITASDVTTTVTTYLTTNGVNTTGITVTYSNLTTPSATDPYQASQSDHLRVSVTLPFSNVRYIALTSLTGITQLNGTADWNSMLDTNVTVPTTLPTN